MNGEDRIDVYEYLDDKLLNEETKTDRKKLGSAHGGQASPSKKDATKG